MFQFVRRLFSRSPSETDLSYGLLKAQGFENQLADKQWDDFEAAAQRLAPDDLTRLLDGLCLTNRYAPLLQEYLAAGRSELRTLVTGARALFAAWEARGGLVADGTSQQQFDGFTYYLEKALDLLSQPFAEPRLQAEAAARLVRVSMGLGEQSLAHEAFDCCTSLVPTHLMGHFNYLRMVSPWWHGGLAELTAFVEAVTDSELYRVLQLIYLHEIHSFLAHDTGSTAEAGRRLRQDYAKHLEAALAGPPQQPGHSLPAVYYNNYLAGLHHLLGNPAARNRLLLALGPHITPNPWNYFGLTTAHDVQKLAT